MPEPRGDRAGAAGCAAHHGRHLGVLQRRPREDLHASPSARLEPRRQARSSSIQACAGHFAFIKEIAAWSQPTTISCGCSTRRAIRCSNSARSRAASSRRRGRARASCSSRTPSSLGPAPQHRRADDRRLVGRSPRRPGDLRAVAVEHPRRATSSSSGCSRRATGRRALRAGDLADGSRRDRAARRRAARPGASRRARTTKWRRVPADRRSGAAGAEVARARLRQQKLERMRDGRAVYIGAERVDDVTAHPAFRDGAHTIAGLYDLKADPGKARAVLIRGGRRAHQSLLAALPQPRRSRAPHALLQGDRGRHLRLHRPLARPGVGADHRARDECRPARRTCTRASGRTCCATTTMRAGTISISASP